ncbi:MAG: hypothetical protein ACR2Q4_00585 [Geminicoccaceae bacterium]
MDDILKALESVRDVGLMVGPTWDAAHEVAQSREGEAAYDRLHAFLHRLEGDQSNAGYWYRRSGEPLFRGDLAAECDLLIERHRNP